MEIVNKSVAELVPYVRNNKIHNERQIKLIASSIQEFGFKQPIVIDKKNSIVAGHGRYQAALKLGLKQVPCVVANDLTKAQIKAYRIADNKLTELADWDEEMLELELQDLQELDFNIEALGFDDEEIDALNKEINFEPGEESEQGQLDKLSPKIVTCPYCGEKFDERKS